jgi:hypothetical protein
MSSEEPLSGLNTHFLMIENVTLPAVGSWELSIEGEEYRQAFRTIAKGEIAIAVAVPSLANYSLRARTQFGSGVFSHGGDHMFEVTADSSFGSDVIVTFAPTLHFTVPLSGRLIHGWRVIYQMATFVVTISLPSS